MSRHFTAPNDELQVAPGAMTGMDGGPITIGVILRFDTVSGFQRILRARTSGGSEVFALAIDSGQIYFATTAGFVGCASGLTANTRYLYVAQKANASSPIRDHLYNFETSTWTHANRGSVGDGTGPVANVLFSDSGARLQAYVAVAGVGDFIPASDTAVETLDTGMQQWVDLGFDALWRFNDTPVNDLVGSANQTAIVGTTVDTSEAVEPPDFNYSLGGGSTQKGAMALFM